MRNLMILAKWLAGRVDVDVVEYNGHTACIDIIDGRRVIKIPRAWSYSSDPQAADLLEGVIDHEALGHGRFTDLLARRKAEDAGLIKFTQFSSQVQNILEDVYIENQAIAAYPGVKANLSRTIEILTGRGFFGTPEKFAQADGARLVLAGLLNILRSRLVPGQDQALQENVEALEVLLPHALGSLWDEVLSIAMEVQASKSTADNIALTIRIMTLFEQASKEDGQEQGQEQNHNQGDGQQGKGQGDSGATSDLADDQPQPGGEGGDDGQQAQNGSDSPSCEGDGSSKGAARAGKSSHRTQNEIDAAKSICDSQDQEMPSTEIGEAISQAISRMAEPSPVLKESDACKKVSDAAMRICSQVKNASDELQDALVTQVQCEKAIKLVGKRLANRVLHRVRLGDPRVFQCKHEGEGVSTAVGLLVDQSSSMDEKLLDTVRRLDAAIGLAYGLGDMLDEFDVPFQVNSFSDCYATLKAFEADWTQVRKPRERPDIAGGTYTGAAMQRALADLVVRPEARKLLLVLSDGNASDLEVLMSCYSEAREMGIEVASVMIGPTIQSISLLAQKFGFKATNINTSAGLGRFAVDRVLEAI